MDLILCILIRSSQCRKVRLAIINTFHTSIKVHKIEYDLIGVNFSYTKKIMIKCQLSQLRELIHLMNRGVYHH